MADYEFLLGFETGDLKEWMGTLGTAPIVQSAVKRSGNYALKIPNTSEQQLVYGGWETYPSESCVRFYLYVETAPDEEAKLFVYENVNYDNVCEVKLTPDRYLKLYNNLTGTPSLIGTSTTQLALNTWYRIDVYVKIDSTAGALKLRINGVEEISSETENTGTDNLDGFYFGISVATALGEGVYYFDDIAVNNTGNYIPDGKIVCLLPNGNGEGDPLDVGSYQDIDETPISEADTAQFTGTGDVYRVFDFENCADKGIEGTINAVQVKTWIKRGAGGPTTFYVREKDNGVYYDTEISLQTDYYMRGSPVRLTRPGGGSWTTAVLDAYMAGMRKGSGGQDMINAWEGIMVDYTPPAPPPPVAAGAQIVNA